MERETLRRLSEAIQALNDKQKEKLQNLTEATFTTCWTRIHTVNAFHREFVINSLSDSVYKFAPRIPSGYISKEGKKAIEEGRTIRSKLCHEHPITRRSTGIALINTMDNHLLIGSSNTTIQREFLSILYEGSQVNLVLSEENTRLMPFQKKGLEPQECYERAGIILVEDVREPERIYYYLGKSYTSQPEIARDWNISRTTVQRRIKRGEITVERKAA